MISWNNLDTLASYKELFEVEKVDLAAAMTGENGAERVWLPKGTRIDNAQESRMTAGSVTYNISISAKDVKQFNDIIRIAQNARVTSRMG